MFNRDMNFSLWCDFIERDFLENDFLNLIDSKIINGATSNPAIFKSSFLGSNAYKKTIEENKRRGAKEIYELLATQDIKIAAYKLIKNFAEDDDGFVSIEVDPNLCDDAAATAGWCVASLNAGDPLPVFALVDSAFTVGHGWSSRSRRLAMRLAIRVLV